MTGLLTTRREILGMLLAWTATLLRDSGSSVTVVPNPPKACEPATVGVRGMPATGQWTVTVSYSTGDSDHPKSFSNSSSGSVGTDPPAGSAGGTMTVTVTVNGTSSQQSFPVAGC